MLRNWCWSRVFWKGCSRTNFTSDSAPLVSIWLLDFWFGYGRIDDTQFLKIVDKDASFFTKLHCSECATLCLCSSCWQASEWKLTPLSGRFDRIIGLVYAVNVHPWPFFHTRPFSWEAREHLSPRRSRNISRFPATSSSVAFALRREQTGSQMKSCHKVLIRHLRLFCVSVPSTGLASPTAFEASGHLAELS